MRHCIQFLLCLAVGLLCALPACAQSEADHDLARRLFQEAERKFDSAKTLRYTVERTTKNGRSTLQERWEFRYRSPDQVRIDYRQPQERVLVINRDDVWEYIPAARKAMRTRIGHLPAAKKAPFLASLLARVAVDGLRLGDTRDLLDRLTSVQTVGTATNFYVVEGLAPRYAVTLDGSRKVLLNSEIYEQNGDLKVRTSAHDFAEVLPGTWIPGRIRATYGTKDSFVVSDVLLSGVRINEGVSEEDFNFTPRKGIEIIEN